MPPPFALAHPNGEQSLLTTAFPSNCAAAATPSWNDKKAGPSAFGQARDEKTAWREQQWAALSEQQRERYEQLRQESLAKYHEHAEELGKTQDQRIDEEKRRLLLHHPSLALRVMPTRPLKEQYAQRQVTHAIERRDYHELDLFEHQELGCQDQFLRQAEQTRQQAEQGRAQEAAARQSSDLAPSILPTVQRATPATSAAATTASGMTAKTARPGR